jgi:hypothetical protein
VCVDYYRQLNAIMVKGRHPLPLIDELVGKKYFAEYDLPNAYHHLIRMNEEGIRKTAEIYFACVGRVHYEVRIYLVREDRILVLYRPGKPCEVHTDASDKAIGAE